MSDLTPLIEEQKEWNKVIVFTADKKVLVSKNCQPNEQQLTQYIDAYQSRDDTITKGIDLEQDHFDIHRFHPPLIYGRIANEELNEGISLAKGKNKEDEVVYFLVTYLLPIVSARAIPQQIEFFNQNIGELDKLYDQFNFNYLIQMKS